MGAVREEQRRSPVRLFGWSLGLLLVAAVAAGCGSDSGSGSATTGGGGGGGGGGGKVYTTSPVDVKVDDRFAISLEANPSTGYSWELTGPLDDKVVVELGSDHQPGQGSGVGVPGQQLFRFQAVGQGTATIGLQYVRPWESGVPPAKTSEFVVNVT
jgi:inhibitor of cysteine peptidase